MGIDASDISGEQPEKHVSDISLSPSQRGHWLLRGQRRGRSDAWRTRCADQYSDIIVEEIFRQCHDGMVIAVKTPPILKRLDARQPAAIVL